MITCAPGLVLAPPHALVRSQDTAEVFKIGNNRLSSVCTLPCTPDMTIATCGSLIYRSSAGNMEACDMQGSTVQQISIPMVFLPPQPLYNIAISLQPHFPKLRFPLASRCMAAQSCWQLLLATLGSWQHSHPRPMW